MGDLIPLLAAVISDRPSGQGSDRPSARRSDRPSDQGGVVVPEAFVQEFVAVHGQDWDRAQAHWERIVERVLDTDAVDARATGRRAIRQAVAATVILLARSDLRGRCPLCPRPSVAGVPMARGGVDE